MFVVGGFGAGTATMKASGAAVISHDPLAVGREGTHCPTRPEGRTPLQQDIRKLLLKPGSAAGTFRISPRKQGNPADWRDRPAPVLTDGPGTPTTPVPPGDTCTGTTASCAAG